MVKVFYSSGRAATGGSRLPQAKEDSCSLSGASAQLGTASSPCMGEESLDFVWLHFCYSCYLRETKVFPSAASVILARKSGLLMTSQMYLQTAKLVINSVQACRGKVFILCNDKDCVLCNICMLFPVLQTSKHIVLCINTFSNLKKHDFVFNIATILCTDFTQGYLSVLGKGKRAIADTHTATDEETLVGSASGCWSACMVWGLLSHSDTVVALVHSNTSKRNKKITCIQH